MTSIPASRSAWATTLAPRSCPSRPGLASNTLIGFVIISFLAVLKLSVQDLSQHARQRLGGMDEGIPVALELPGFPVDGAHAFGGQLLQDRRNVSNPVGD